MLKWKLMIVRFFRSNWPLALLLLFVALGAFFRFWDLANIPPGVYPDEAKNANDAIDTIISGEYKLFYPENNGREGLYIWLLAVSFQLFGISIFSLKAVSALAGVLTIWGVYLLTKELMQFADQYTLRENFAISAKIRETAAILAAGFTAVSFWHVNFSRISFRAILVPLLLSFALYFLLRAYRTNSSLFYILAGAAWGAGLYTYIAFRVAYLIPVFFLLLSFVFYLMGKRSGPPLQWLRNVFVRDGWWKVKLLFGFSLLGTMAPMLLYFYNNPGDFISRAGGISVFDAANPVLEFVKSFALHAQMLFFAGDSNWRHNFASDAQLFWPVAILFVFGAWYSLQELINSWRSKNRTGVTAHLTLAFALGVMILPAALTLEGIPHALRAIGMIPFVFIYAAFGFIFLIQKLFPHRYHQEEIWPFSVMAVVVIILLLSSHQFTHYFVDWGRNKNVEGAFNKGYVEIGRYFNELPSEVDKYLIVNADGVGASYPQEVLPQMVSNQLPMPAQTVLFIQRQKEIPIENTKYITDDNLSFNISTPSVFVPLKPTEEIKNALRTIYPFGRAVQYEYFWSWEII
jgi:hypothetical protein